MASEDKDYKQSALGQRVNELMDDGYDFGEAVKQAMSEGLKDGGSVGIEILFGPKREDFNIGGNVQRATTPQPYDSRATVADFARAIDRVGAGTDLQKAMDIQRYGQNVQRQNLLDRVGYTQHMNEDRMLKDANIENQLMNRMGGLNVTQANPAFGLENPFGPGIGMTMLGGAAGAYQGIQSLLGDQSIGEMIKDTYENTMGPTILANPEQLEMYNKALNRPTDPVIDQDRISEIVEQQKAAGVPDKGLITNFDPTPTPDAGLQAAYEDFLGIGPGQKYQLRGNEISLEDFRKNVYEPNQKEYQTPDRPTMADVAGPAATGINNYDIGTTQFLAPNYRASRDPGENINPNSIDSARVTTPEGKTLTYQEYINMLPGLKEKYAEDYERSKGYFPDMLASGGRVGLFMGGDPLTGQALSIYNSMNAYGFNDQEIADALSAQGLYTAGGSTPVVEEGIISVAPNIINQGGGGDGPPKGPTFNRNDLLGTPDYFPAEPFSFKNTISDIGEYIKGGGIIGAGIRGLKGLFSRNTKNYVTTPQVKARDRVEAERKAREEAARQEVERQAAYAQARQDRETYKDLEASITSGQGGQGFDRPSSGPTATGAGMGAGGGYASDYGFKDGGLVTMFKEKR